MYNTGASHYEIKLGENVTEYAHADWKKISTEELENKLKNSPKYKSIPNKVSWKVYKGGDEYISHSFTLFPQISNEHQLHSES